MVSAIWSMPPYQANQMPLKFFLRFFQNHGLFKLKNRPQWYTVSNRSRTYVENILSKISGEHFKNYTVTKIKSNTNGIDLYYGCLLYTSPSPRDVEESRMPSSA